MIKTVQKSDRGKGNIQQKPLAVRLFRRGPILRSAFTVVWRSSGRGGMVDLIGDSDGMSSGS
jgi:hypothetical protein